MVESAPLLREYTLIAYRGFESLSLRQFINKINNLYVFFAIVYCSVYSKMRSQLDNFLTSVHKLKTCEN